ncbi:FAD-dependent monooxygenase [Lipingzhangella sp. LS1_29]|uniref:FAD-dependent monooxygenase n=1 Tax=Lipingzhangella rawalii TaxID=2055835 RepID=A0ABU2H7S7_9ACTN|nr:FAD-dependent monooxygenase [Lipingzhangella rawalii]MDS1270915.1 FAD-dependent monooxygenase [Lipingzhangella rawalii]
MAVGGHRAGQGEIGSIECDVCVVGGGPAGMTLALLLATQGREVVVLEKSRSFERSFRGESIAPDSAWLLDELGVLHDLRRQGILDVRAMELSDAGQRMLTVDFDEFDQPVRYPVEIPQPMLLGQLARTAEQYPGFRLIQQCSAVGLCFDGDRVAGVLARTSAGDLQVNARLTVGADGRYSKVREWASMDSRVRPLERDFLWFTIPCPPVWSNDTYRVRISGDRHAMCIPTYPDLVRVGVNIPKNGLKELRAAGIEALHTRVRELAPELTDHVQDSVRSWSNTSRLDIFTTEVPRWSRPGLVLVGDAAHTLSPVLAQGVNHAIIDGVSLAPLVAPTLERRDLAQLDQACVEFQASRQRHVAQARAMQLRQEKLFALSSPAAQALRRRMYRTVDRVPALRKRIWGRLYYSLAQRGDPTRTGLPPWSRRHRSRSEPATRSR